MTAGGEPSDGSGGAAAPQPYKGLAPFEASELDALFFFGRERERELVTANLVASPLTILFGPSGVGKSSLLRAGVAFSLAERARRNVEERGEPEFAVVVFASWRHDPVAELRDAIAAGVDDLLGEDRARRPATGVSLADVAAETTRRIAGPLYLILDGLEEYFLYHGDDESPGTLVRELPELVNARGARVNVLLAIREDELSKLDVLKPRLPNLFANSLRLDHLDRAAARAAVLGPLQRYGRLARSAGPISAETSLVESVVDEVATGKIDAGHAGRGTVESRRDDRHVETPYLQLVMQRLWDVERSEGSEVIRLETLRRLGGAQRIVEEHLERAMASLTTRERDVAATMFAHLVTPSGTKIAHALPDLASYAAASEAEAGQVVRTLTDERVLRPLGDRGRRNGRYEIFHDVLADAVLAWRTRHEAERELERERAAARARHRRLGAVAAAALVALVVVAAVAVYALVQRAEAREQARSAEARELAASAFSQLATDPELSILLALEAARRERTPRVEEALRQALIESRQRLVLDAGRGRQVLAATPLVAGGVAVTVGDDGVLRHFGLESARPARAVSLGGPLRQASFSAGGEFLVTVGGAPPLRVWSATTARRVAAFGHAAPIRAAAVSADARLVATVSPDRRVRVLASRTGRIVRSFAVEPIPTAVALSADGSLVAVGGTDGTAEIRPTSGRRSATRLVGHGGWVIAAAFDPGRRLIATGSTDGTARVWEVASGDLVAVLTGHGNFVTSTAFGDGGRVLVTASRDRTARVWDPASGRALAVLRGHRDAVRAAVLDSSGDVAVTAGADGTARVWAARAEPRLEVVRRLRAPVVGIAYAPRSGVLVAAAGSEVAVSNRGEPGWTVEDEREIAAVSVATDGTLAATAAGNSATVWDLDGRRALRALAHPARVTAVSLSGDGALVATGAEDGVARIWTATGDAVREVSSPSPVNDVAFDGRRARLVTAGADGVARIWSVESGKLLQELRGHKAAVTAAEFSRDGRLLATASADHDGRLWDASSGRPLAVLSGHFGRVSDIALNAGGRWAVTAGPASAALWETRTGRLVFYLRGHRGMVASADFADADDTAFTAGADGTVRTYRCDICGDLEELASLARDRLARTGRALSDDDRRRYLNGD